MAWQKNRRWKMKKILIGIAIFILGFLIALSKSATITGWLIVVLIASIVILAITAIVKKLKPEPEKPKEPEEPDERPVPAPVAVKKKSVCAWIGGIVISVAVLVVTGIIGYKIIAALITPPAPCPSIELPLCGEREDYYDFPPGKNRVDIPLRPDCWSQYIKIPLDATFFEVSSRKEGWHERWNWDGSKNFAGEAEIKTPKIKLSRTARKGTFRLRGKGVGGIAVVIIERGAPTKKTASTETEEKEI
jgi:uncharacterized membrane protein